MNDNAPNVLEAPVFSIAEGNITAPIELGAHTCTTPEVTVEMLEMCDVVSSDVM